VWAVLIHVTMLFVCRADSDRDVRRRSRRNRARYWPASRRTACTPHFHTFPANRWPPRLRGDPPGTFRIRRFKAGAQFPRRRQNDYVHRSCVFSACAPVADGACGYCPPRGRSGEPGDYRAWRVVHQLQAPSCSQWGRSSGPELGRVPSRPERLEWFGEGDAYHDRAVGGRRASDRGRHRRRNAGDACRRVRNLRRGSGDSVSESLVVRPARRRTVALTLTRVRKLTVVGVKSGVPARLLFQSICASCQLNLSFWRRSLDQRPFVKSPAEALQPLDV